MQIAGAARRLPDLWRIGCELTEAAHFEPAV